VNTFMRAINCRAQVVVDAEEKGMSWNVMLNASVSPAAVKSKIQETRYDKARNPDSRTRPEGHAS